MLVYYSRNLDKQIITLPCVLVDIIMREHEFVRGQHSETKNKHMGQNEHTFTKETYEEHVESCTGL